MARAKLGDMLSVVNGAQGAPEMAPVPETTASTALAAVPAQAPDRAPGSPEEDSSAPAGDAKPTIEAGTTKTHLAKKTAKRAPVKKTASAASPVVASLPRYLELERKEVRIRDDQLAALTATSRRLNKRRRGRGERITENTLIRVAIDLLLEKDDALGGFTEEELRDSVGL
jgi:hypothetical protein